MKLFLSSCRLETTTRIANSVLPRLMAGLFAILEGADSMAADPVPLRNDKAGDSDAWSFVAEYSDEFNADTIDRKKWNIGTEDFGVWSWAPENVSQKGGSMRLRMVQKEHRRGQQTLYYTSGKERQAWFAKKAGK